LASPGLVTPPCPSTSTPVMPGSPLKWLPASAVLPRLPTGRCDRLRSGQIELSV